MPSNVKLLAGASGGEPTDANFKNVTLLLHGDGSNGAQNNTFIDSSTNNFTITRNGNTTQGSFSPYGSNWSNYFDGTDDHLTVASNAAFAFGTGDFTIECWVYVANTSSQMIFVDLRGASSSTTAPLIYMTSSGVVNYYTNGSVQITGTGISANSWNHLAVSRSGTSTKLFINGTQAGSTYSDSNNYVQSSVYIGRASDTAGSFVTGYMSNVRILKGTALYTSNFTPSTTPLTAITNTSLLTCAYNRFRDGSTNNFTITRNGDVKVTNFAPFAPSSAYSTTTNGGSAYFAGNEDFLTSPDNAAVQLGSGNFTIEMWVYFSAAMMADQQVLLFNGSNANSYGPYKLFYNGANNLKLYGSTNGSSWDIFNGLDVITTVVSDCWYHIALVRSGSTFSAYANGVRQSTASVSGSLVSTGTPVRIGAADAFGSYNFLGFISNFRMVKGTAVYDPSQTTLTVPTSPVTAITNTSLLLNATNAAIFDNSMKNDLETVGNAQISTSVKKFGTGSMYFDGSGDYLTRPNSDLNNLGTGDFTIELWFKSDTGTMNTHACLVASYSNPTSGSWALKAQSGTSGYIEFASYGPSWNDWITTTNIAADQAWHHCAATRSGNTLRIFVDGTVRGTWDISGANSFTGGGHPLTIGFMAQDPTSYINGNIDDVRITRGIARYTANFTPPTAPFPNK